MNRSIFALPFALLATLLLAPDVHAADPGVDEVVRRANIASYYAGDDGRARVKMVITDDRGRSRVREMTVLRRDVADGGDQKFSIHFHAPADVAKIAYIVHKHVGVDDDRWLYLPALDLEKRIASADKRTSFAGSDFVYEDISGRSTDLDRHELLEPTKDFYVLKNTPKDPGSVEFSKYVMYVHKKTYLPMKVVFYDKAGDAHRVLQVDEVRRVGGHTTVTRATMVDRATGSQTVVRYSDVRYDLGLPDRVFGKRALRRVPVKYLR